MIIIIIFLIFIIGIFIILNRTKGNLAHNDYIKEELEKNPDYIVWLKYANDGRDYKLGLKILKKIKRNRDNLYNRWFKKIRKIGKY